jgi:hypothetical protein
MEEMNEGNKRGKDGKRRRLGGLRDRTERAEENKDYKRSSDYIFFER